MGPDATPLLFTVKTSMLLVAFSVTTSRSPSVLKAISSGATDEALRGRPLTIDCRVPSPLTAKPAIVSLPPTAPPSLRTYKTLRLTLRLIGFLPPEATRVTRLSPFSRMRKTEMSLLGVYSKQKVVGYIDGQCTLTTQSASRAQATGGNVPCGLIRPSAERLNSMTAFPSLEFVRV